jgi:hypothetical protein
MNHRGVRRTRGVLARYRGCGRAGDCSSVWSRGARLRPVVDGIDRLTDQLRLQHLGDRATRAAWVCFVVAFVVLLLSIAGFVHSFLSPGPRPSLRPDSRRADGRHRLTSFPSSSGPVHERPDVWALLLVGTSPLGSRVHSSISEQERRVVSCGGFTRCEGELGHRLRPLERMAPAGTCAPTTVLTTACPGVRANW